MADGCREKFDPEFFAYIWKFHKAQRPNLLAELDGFSGEKIVLSSPAAVRQFFGRRR